MKTKKPRIITCAVESPFRDFPLSVRYLEKCLEKCVEGGLSPYASHKMLTSVLNDNNKEERELGIRYGLEIASQLDLRIFFTDYGWSEGMLEASKFYEENKLPWFEIKIGKLGE